jgi:opacity protein-like surface antigen
MRHSFWIGIPAYSLALMVASLVLSAIPIREANATDPLGMYVGGAVGQSQVSAYADSASFLPIGSGGAGEFKENHAAFKAIVGIRPISLFGVELEYADLGHPSGNLFGYPADASIKGTAAFGMLFLPVPVVDIYVKAGAARLQSTLSGIVPYLPLCGGCAPPRFEQDRTNTAFAAGAGAQYKFGSLAVRAEYERFSAAGEHPSVVWLGLTWTFL